MSSGNRAADYKALIAEMAGIAKDLERTNVLDCYCENALRVFIHQQGETPCAPKMFARLQAAVDARSEIHELERGIDKDHFVELVTGGYFMAGGRGKDDKRENILVSERAFQPKFLEVCGRFTAWKGIHSVSSPRTLFAASVGDVPSRSC